MLGNIPAVRNFLTGGGSNTAVRHFDIRSVVGPLAIGPGADSLSRLQSDSVVLTGLDVDAAAAVLKGKLVLCTTEPLKLVKINMKLAGTKTTTSVPAEWLDLLDRADRPSTRFRSYHHGATTYSQQSVDFFRQDWTIQPDLDSKHVMKPDNYEWPFEIDMPGNLQETVEGRHANKITYHLKATIDRGMYGKDIIKRQYLRVIRTISPESMELQYGCNLSNTWPGKVAYEVTTPRRAVRFGSIVTFQCKIIPLAKGLRVGKVTSVIVEQSDVTTENKGELPRRKREEREVVKDQWTMPADAEVVDLDGAEGHYIERDLALPTSFLDCTQSVEVESLAVKHWVKSLIQLHNLDGHVSEVNAAHGLRWDQYSRCCSSASNSPSPYTYPETPSLPGQAPSSTQQVAATTKTSQAAERLLATVIMKGTCCTPTMTRPLSSPPLKVAFLHEQPAGAPPSKVFALHRTPSR